MVRLPTVIATHIGPNSLTFQLFSLMFFYVQVCFRKCFLRTYLLGTYEIAILCRFRNIILYKPMCELLCIVALLLQNFVTVGLHTRRNTYNEPEFIIAYGKKKIFASHFS